MPGTQEQRRSCRPRRHVCLLACCSPALSRIQVLPPAAAHMGLLQPSPLSFTSAAAMPAGPCRRVEELQHSGQYRHVCLVMTEKDYARQTDLFDAVFRWAWALR